MVGKCRRTSSTTCRSGFKWGGDACPREGYCVAPSRLKKRTYQRTKPYKKDCQPWQLRQTYGKAKGRCVNKNRLNKRIYMRSKDMYNFSDL